MKEILSQFAAYNTWANQKLFDLILTLPEEKQLQELPSSFKNLYTTMLHMWDAESVWWQRMKLQEQIILPSKAFHPDPNLQEVANGLLNQSKQWKEWVSNATGPQLEHVFAYYNSK